MDDEHRQQLDELEREEKEKLGKLEKEELLNADDSEEEDGLDSELARYQAELKQKFASDAVSKLRHNVLRRNTAAKPHRRNTRTASPG